MQALRVPSEQVCVTFQGFELNYTQFSHHLSSSTVAGTSNKLSVTVKEIKRSSLLENNSFFKDWKKL